jgi:uncharacterized protein (DUF1800 family)
MDELMRAVEAELRATPSVRLVLATAGGGFLGGVTEGRVYVRMAPHEERTFSLGRLWTSLWKGRPLAAFQGNYTQRDVMEVARALTGWTVRSTEAFRKGAVEFQQDLHDDGAKEILGTHVPAGLGAADLDRVLAIVALHPATAQHLATKLCRHFIVDDPPAAAVVRVADAFLRSAGDIRDTLRVLFATPEFLAARGTRLKRPFHYLVSALRATGAETDAARPLTDHLSRMGEAPYQYPSPDGYPDVADPWTGSLLWRWNFAVALASGQIRGTSVDQARLKRALGDEAGIMAHFLGRQATPDEAAAYRDSGAGVALMLASPGFQRY